MSDILEELRTQHKEIEEAGDCDVDGFCSDDEPVEPEPAGQELEYLTGKQLATKLNVSVKAVVKWTAARRIPACKMGRLWRYPRIEIEKRLLSGSLLYNKK
jgi:excisionase family DNA binding protein